jgi:RNA polymerase sigma-70 factor (ECF subfamily)
MNGESDEALLSAIQADDEISLRELFGRHYAALCRFSYGLTRQRDLAEDAVLRVFEDLWHGRRELRIHSSVKAWLYGATRLQALDRLRVLSRARQRTTPLEDFHSAIADPSPGHRAILHEEMQDEVRALLAALPPQRQLVFRLSRLDGLRYREIAEILQVSEQTVQNHMVLAVRQLAPALPRLRELIQS